MTIKAITIPAAEDQEITYGNHPGDLQGLQASVGGDVEAVGNGNITIWMDETGKLTGKPANPRATKIARRSGLISLLDVIAGDAVITGGADHNGDNTSATTENLDLLN